MKPAPQRNLPGRRFKEATLNGNEEKGNQEGKETRQEETLNDPRRGLGLANFLP
jgi:hypothetical protein